jgi:hypothetical protein
MSVRDRQKEQNVNAVILALNAKKVNLMNNLSIAGKDARP